MSTHVGMARFLRVFSSWRGDKPPGAALNRDQGIWLLAAAALSLMPLLPNLPFWAIALCAALLAWRGRRIWHGQSAPPRWILLPLALIATFGVQMSFGQMFGKTPGVVLLAVLLVLKLIETRDMRDIRIVAFLCFFLQFSLFFNDQSLSGTFLVLPALLAVLGSQIALADPASGARERLKTGGLLFAQALPFMAALFFLFPRSVAPLWGIPDNATATSGLSDSMSPGSISEMILSDDPAFTAEFDDKPPPPADRYWRGPVLSHFDGTTWRMALYPPQELPTYTPTGRRYSYKIMLEPHNQQWLPALDYPAGPVEGVRFNRDFQALSSTPVTRRARIALDAFPDTRVGLTEHGWTFRYAHQLPIRGNPRARALAAELKAGTSAKTVERILDWLAAGGFVYTLKPPRLKENNIDAFLFDTRMGFCEHFAGSFVFLARAADIPARVVTGYQGGRINPVDKTISVRQSDAHAWAEVWLAERGWVRVDPTALVAPLRIEYGLEGSLDTGLPFMLRPENSWLRQLRDRKEAFTMQWYRMVVGYDGRQQRDLLKNVGLNEFSVPVMLGAIAIATAFLMAAFYFWAQHRRENPDPLDRAWARFSARLAPLGLAREPAEGPLDYGRRLATIRPSEATTLMSICTRYARLRYCPPSSHKEICELTHAIDVLDIRKAKSRPP